MWGIELVSPSKTYKIPENTLYFGGVFRNPVKHL